MSSIKCQVLYKGFVITQDAESLLYHVDFRVFRTLYGAKGYVLRKLREEV